MSQYHQNAMGQPASICQHWRMNIFMYKYGSKVLKFCLCVCMCVCVCVRARMSDKHAHLTISMGKDLVITHAHHQNTFLKFGHLSLSCIHITSHHYYSMTQLSSLPHTHILHAGS